MEQKEFNDCMLYMDIVEVMIREKKAKEFIEKGQYEDAVAYAMAAGFRMGWDAHIKKVEEEKKKTGL